MTACSPSAAFGSPTPCELPTFTLGAPHGTHAGGAAWGWGLQGRRGCCGCITCSGSDTPQQAAVAR